MGDCLVNLFLSHNEPCHPPIINVSDLMPPHIGGNMCAPLPLAQDSSLFKTWHPAGIQQKAESRKIMLLGCRVWGGYGVPMNIEHFHKNTRPLEALGVFRKDEQD